MGDIRPQYSPNIKRLYIPPQFRNNNTNISMLNKTVTSLSKRSGKSENSAKHICLKCLVGPNVCDGRNNDMIHICGKEMMNNEFIKFIRKIAKKSPKFCSPVHHSISTNNDKINHNSKGKLPCKFCLNGICDRWKTDTSVQHIFGWYFPLNKKEAKNLIKFWNEEIERRNYELLKNPVIEISIDEIQKVLSQLEKKYKDVEIIDSLENKEFVNSENIELGVVDKY